MRYEVREDGSEVSMQVTQVGDRAPAVFASIQQCQQGQCSCPTDQYDRLESIDVQMAPDQITVTLRPREGERLDVEQLRACMDYTLDQASE